MTGGDARFEDAPAGGQTLRLKAESVDDLSIVSSLLQDAVGKAGDIAWLPKKHRLLMLVNRFQWESNAGEGAQPQRVRSIVSVESVLAVRARGLDPKAPGQVFSLLAILFEPGRDGAGTLTLSMAGGAELAADVECLEISLADQGAPWPAKAGRAPRHEE